MMYLDFENEKWQKGYEPFRLTRENIKANIGKKICYLLSRDIDHARGWFNVRYGRIHSLRRNELFLNEGHDSISIRNVVEAGIESCTNP